MSNRIVGIFLCGVLQVGAMHDVKSGYVSFESQYAVEQQELHEYTNLQYIMGRCNDAEVSQEWRLLFGDSVTGLPLQQASFCGQGLMKVAASVGFASFVAFIVWLVKTRAHQ